MNRASNDQYGTISLALRHLTALGYQRIGLAITAESDQRVKQYWSAGMLVYQEGISRGQRVPPLLATGPFTRSFGEWFSEHRPEVVLSLGGQCLRVLQELGLRVPQDVGFAHLALTASDKEWAGVNQNSELVGAAAVDLVDAQLRRNERGIPEHAKTVLIPGQWVPGPTVRDLNARPRRARTRRLAEK
jgi:LacI family transcriptional regulator